MPLPPEAIFGRLSSAARESQRQLSGRVEIDDAYLSGERPEAELVPAQQTATA